MSDEEQKDDAFLDEDFGDEFDDGGGDDAQKKKKIAILVAALVLVGGLFFYLTGEDTSFEEDIILEQKEGMPKKEESDATAVSKEEKKDKKERKSKKKRKKAKEEESSGERVAVASGVGALALLGPENGLSRFYDLSSDRPVFSWQGNADTIVFSRSPDMSSIVYSEKTNGSSHAGRYFKPGSWYWQVRNSSGASEVRSFNIIPSDERGLSLLAPQDGGEMTGDSSIVSWSTLERGAYYRVQMTQGDTWVNPSYVFATSGSQLAVKNVPPGSYKLRVGGFSEISGRWEYTDSIAIEVR